MKAIVFDIETVSNRHDEYKEAFPKSKKKAGLHAIISQAVCIGMHDGIASSCIAVDEFDTEQAVLEWFSGVLREHNNSSLVGFNIKNFDIPFLQLRAMKYDIKLDFPDIRSNRIIDIYQAIGGKWQTDISACSLSELSWFLYDKCKATNGNEIQGMWDAGDIEGIREHCLEDVEITNRIYQDFKGCYW